MLKAGTCIGFLPDAGCGLLYLDEPYKGSQIAFVHFRDIQPKSGWQGLEANERVRFALSDEAGKVFCRPCAAVGADHGFVGSLGLGAKLVFKTVAELEGLALKPHQILVITGVIPKRWQPEAWLFKQKDVLFYDCTWTDKAQCCAWQVQGDLVLLGCTFQDSFSLKESDVQGAVHMEGCNFSGAGGASFRGLKAQSLYMDFGVKGPRDMVWLNEMHIKQDVVIGGVFDGTIQVLRLQDERVTSLTCQENEAQNRACFQRLYIGKEFYKSQNINKTVLDGGLDVQGLTHGEQLYIDHAAVGELSCLDVGGNIGLHCEQSKVLGNVRLSGKDSMAQVQQVSFQGSYIEGHCEIRHMTLQGSLDFDDATVERVIRLTKVSFVGSGGLKLARLCANRLVMDDYAALYGIKNTEVWWRNPKFLMLEREHVDKALNAGPPVALIQEYVLLKNLLSQEGQLKLEDEAFYNMRQLNHWYQDLGMLLLNTVFGWGVRLQNILMSVLFLILCFAGLYHQCFDSFNVSEALQLSLQSMLMAFFGELSPKVMAGSTLSWLVLLESVLGVIFVTVFVGAYVRKLLR